MDAESAGEVVSLDVELYRLVLSCGREAVGIRVPVAAAHLNANL